MSEPAVELSGGQALVRMLREHGARWAFGIGGFQLLPYYDALHDAPPELVHVLVKDERDGAFMADAYARISRTPGVCDGTLGPGATNLVTGLAESYGAGVPVIALAGETNSLISGRHATQESDQLAILRPTVKEALRVDRIERVPELVRRAYAVATGGRPGPVLLNVREDVSHGRHAFPEADLHADPATCRLPGRRMRPDAADVDAAAELLARAGRPVLLAGGGVHLSGAYDELAALAERFALPVATTIGGKGAISERHPLALGVFGRYSRAANAFIADADVLLVVGCKLGEIATNRWSLLPAGASVIQLDVSPEELGRNARLAVGMIGDAALGLADLLAAAPEPRPRNSADIEAAKRAWEAEHEPRRASEERPVHQARLLRELNAVLPEDGILVADGGFAAHWSALYWEVARAGRHYVANRGHASIGYGVPAAIGAKLAAPDRAVAALVGDGGLAMSIGELETAVRLGLDGLVFVVVDNQASGYVKALQHSLYDGRFQSVDSVDVDYSRVAREFGVHAERVEDPAALAPAFDRALGAGGPALVDVCVTRDPSGMLPGTDPRTAERSTT
ncbi:MAG: thiamine pyrophosphate-binding protein [Solirubrobacterales bacterium]|nr:thiamine pyrophosphate-binding protein [Solirubrobacterales bacterium]